MSPNLRTRIAVSVPAPIFEQCLGLLLKQFDEFNIGLVELGLKAKGK